MHDVCALCGTAVVEHPGEQCEDCSSSWPDAPAGFVVVENPDLAALALTRDLSKVWVQFHNGPPGRTGSNNVVTQRYGPVHGTMHEGMLLYDDLEIAALMVESTITHYSVWDDNWTGHCLFWAEMPPLTTDGGNVTIQGLAISFDPSSEAAKRGLATDIPTYTFEGF